MHSPQTVKRMAAVRSKASQVAVWKGCTPTRTAVLRLLLPVAAAAGCADVPVGSDVADTTPAPLTVEHELWRKGLVEGDTSQEFGAIVGADFDSSGMVHVLDAGAHVVRSFSHDGHAIATEGGMGSGPGELMDAKAIRYHRNRIHVLDARNGLSTFSVTNQRLQFEHTRQLAIQATDFCFLGNRVFVFGYSQGNTIHEFTQAGRHVKSFGGTFGPNHRSVRQVVSAEGRIACLPDNEVIVSIAKLLPEIRAYRASDGELLWTDSVANFQSVMIQMFEDGNTYAMGPGGPGGYAENVSLHLLGNSMLLTQARRTPIMMAPADPSVEVITSCYVSARSGKCVRSTTDLPLFLSIRAGQAIAVEDTLVPVVRLLRVAR
jgi:hypothetical protein